jgi:hypothetical protein
MNTLFPLIYGNDYRFFPFWEIASPHVCEVGMKGDYPRFKVTYTDEELAEHFLLTPAERALVETCRGDVNRHSVAVLLKAVQYLGYFPEELSQVPPVVRTFMAPQLQLLWDQTTHYPRHPSTRDRHAALIRQHTGFRFPTGQDKQMLETWLRTHGAPDAPTDEELRECAYARLRTLGIELPAPQELHRIVQAALRGFFQDVYDRVAARLTAPVCTALDAFLVVGPEETQSLFEQLKAEPAAPGVKPLQQEITKLHTLQTLGLPAEALADVPFKVLQLLKRRAHHEDASRMRAHPAPIRYTLLASFVHVRRMAVTDDAVPLLSPLPIPLFRPHWAALRRAAGRFGGLPQHAGGAAIGGGRRRGRWGGHGRRGGAKRAFVLPIPIPSPLYVCYSLEDRCV